ncbi:hypothetical protein OEZ85_010893 [Tetradesmus obliquus]|uniref:Right handed beta helix domain-containing protein n=1 Tax=Tetradesmus obliquus TaxID=3088 RepID=A0ABY8TNL6_TETOB|nr:hypothetical protein OEZ85_010893 [Tetradesmus obliquus]
MFGGRRLHGAAAAAAKELPADAAAPQAVAPQDAANGPVYGAGILASAGARITFAGATTIRDNTGVGGCGLTLEGATAIFAGAAAVQFISNSAPGSDGFGMALRAVRNSSVVFRGPVLMADNWARSGAGGAVFLDKSNLTFHNIATLRNNSILMGPGMDWGGGGAIYAFASRVVHNAAAMYINNRAGRLEGSAGGAVALLGWITSYSCPRLSGTRSSFSATQLVTFLSNTANTGGALFMTLSDAAFAA